MPLSAVVAGATGLVGSSLVAQLAEDARFGPVTLVGRRLLDGADPRVRQVVVDLAALKATDLPERVDAAFCCLGTTIRTAGSQEAFRAVDHGMVVAFARACAARGARSLHVVSAMGADPGSRVFYNRVKGETERDLRGVGAPSTYAYRPSLLLGDRREPRPAERAGIVAARALAPVLPRRWRAIPAETVARAMLRDAAEPAPGFHVATSDLVARRGAA